MKKTSLSKREIKEINEKIKFSYQIPIKNRVERLFFEHYSVILLESRPILIEYEGKIVPTLLLLQENSALLKKITVDSGAVRFVANGADIMRPGIVACDDGINAGDGVVIVDEKYGKMLAVGLALFSSDEIRAMDKGKVVKNLHYVGDAIWNYKEGR